MRERARTRVIKVCIGDHSGAVQQSPASLSADRVHAFGHVSRAFVLLSRVSRCIKSTAGGENVRKSHFQICRFDFTWRRGGVYFIWFCFLRGPRGRVFLKEGTSETEV